MHDNTYVFIRERIQYNGIESLLSMERHSLANDKHTCMGTVPVIAVYKSCKFRYRNSDLSMPDTHSTVLTFLLFFTKEDMGFIMQTFSHSVFKIC